MATRTLIGEIEHRLYRTQETYEEAKAVFLEKAQQHVGRASEGFLKDVLVAEAAYSLMEGLAAMVKGADRQPLDTATVRSVCTYQAKDAKRRILRYTEFEANSTSPVHNLQRTWEAVARCKYVEWLEEAMEETEDLEAICGNCGQTGTFVLGHEHCDQCEKTAQEGGQGEIQFEIAPCCKRPQNECVCQGTGREVTDVGKDERP